MVNLRSSMSSTTCMGCIPYSSLGKLLAWIQIIIGVVLAILAPFVYDIRYCFYNYYYSWNSCYNIDFALWTVLTTGVVLCVGGVLLLLGLKRANVCFIRTYLLLSIASVISLIACGIVLIVNYNEVWHALGLILPSVWLIISFGCASKYGRVMIATTQEVPLAVVAPGQPAIAPQPVVQSAAMPQAPNVQISNNYVQQPQQPFSNFNQQPPYPYNFPYGQVPNNQPQITVPYPFQQYNPMQAYPGVPGYNAPVHPPYNPMMNSQLGSAGPAYSAPPAPPEYSATPSAPNDAVSNSNPPLNPKF